MVFSRSPLVTLRSICSRGVLPLAVLAAVLAAAAPQPARADDRAAIDQGRSAGRGILIFKDPSGCGIAVLRARCIADVEVFLRGRGDRDFAFVPKIGPHPATGLRAFVADGDRDGFDRALTWINNIEARDSHWKTDARFAALYDAGILTVFLPAANGNQYAEILASAPALDLARHVASIPAGTRPVDVAPLRAMTAEAASDSPSMRRMPQLVPFAKALAAAIAANAPTPAIVAVPRTDTPTADAALGVAFATMVELIDAPLWTTQDDAQALAAALADRLDALVPAAGRADVMTFRTRVRPASLDHKLAAAALAAAGRAFADAAPAERAQRFGLAVGATQLVYNAAILRSPDHAVVLLRRIADAAVLDTAIPGWSDARRAGASIGGSDWAAQHAFALRLVGLIQKVNPA
jgi:hypothetical protein